MNELKIKILKKYLILPANSRVREKHIVLSYLNGKTAFDFDLPLDTVNPKYSSYINVSRFLGEEFDVSVEPEANFTYSFSDTLPGNSDGSDDTLIPRKLNILRPFIHYTVRRGWLSDPNGLFYYGGVYHMMYQYNPASANWGRSMHWGHAVSKDLIHWAECEPSIYPDDMGSMFSGSAWVDSENASGLKKDGGTHDPVILFYTAAGGVSKQSENKDFTQCAAYSTDGGKSFVKYEKNPIIKNMVSENRDPRVMYSREMKKYVMLLYMEENRYALLVSENLLDWAKIQDIELTGDNECPDFYPLKSPDGGLLWVLSGGNDYYTVGKLTKTGFQPVQTSRPFHFGGLCSRAGQTFVYPDSVSCGSLYDRCIRLVYENMHMHDCPFENQMGFPTEMSLVKTGDIYRLRAVPVREIELLYENSTAEENISVSEAVPYKMNLYTGAYDIRLRCGFSVCDFEFTVFGVTMLISAEKNSLTVVNASSTDNVMPLSFSFSEIDIRIICDTAGVEIFAEDGLIYFTCSIQADFGMSYLKIKSHGNMTADSLIINRLKNARPVQKTGNAIAEI